MILAVRTTDGRIVAAGEDLDGLDLPGCAIVPAPPAWTPSDAYLVAGELRPDLDKMTAALVAEIDAERERRQGALVTAGETKKLVYAAKQAEVRERRSLVGGLAALTIAQRRSRFPFAQAEAELTGDTIAAVLDRFETAQAATSSGLAWIEALAQRGKQAVAAAGDAEAKRQAARIQWPA